MDDRVKLAVIHIPKTGGTTLKTLLREPLNKGKRFFSIDTAEDARRFSELPDEVRRTYSGVVGHMPLGIDQIAPGTWGYATFLRDPVERIVSQYYFIKGKLDHPWRQRILDGWSLVDYAHEIEANWQTRQLSHGSIGSFWDMTQPVTEGHLSMAKRNLDHFAFVGLQETFEEDLRRFANLFDLRHPVTTPRLFASERPGINEIPASDIAALWGVTELDRQLWEHAKVRRVSPAPPLAARVFTREPSHPIDPAVSAAWSLYA